MDSVLKNKKYILIFVLPAVIIYIFMIFIPCINSIYVSLFKWNMAGARVFKGLGNYRILFTSDHIFQRALLDTIILMFAALLAHMPVAVSLAWVLSGNIRGKKFFRTVYFMPSVLCSSAVGFLWTFIYNSQFGIVNNVLRAIGLSSWTREWLGDEKTVLWAVIIVVMWQYVGYHMVLYLAAILGIDHSLYESAKIDGATGIQVFFKITLPIIKPILRIDGILITTGALKYFDLIYVMTNGGPNHSSEVLASHMYMQAFRVMKYGYGSAISVVMLVLCLGVTAFFTFAFKTEKLEN